MNLCNSDKSTIIQIIQITQTWTLLRKLDIFSLKYWKFLLRYSKNSKYSKNIKNSKNSKNYKNVNYKKKIEKYSVNTLKDQLQENKTNLTS